MWTNNTGPTPAQFQAAQAAAASQQVPGTTNLRYHNSPQFKKGPLRITVTGKTGGEINRVNLILPDLQDVPIGGFMIALEELSSDYADFGSDSTVTFASGGADPCIRTRGLVLPSSEPNGVWGSETKMSIPKTFIQNKLTDQTDGAFLIYAMQVYQPVSLTTVGHILAQTGPNMQFDWWTLPNELTVRQASTPGNTGTVRATFIAYPNPYWDSRS